MRRVNDECVRRESLFKGWTLFALLTGAFTPSEALFKYVVGFLIDNCNATGIYVELGNMAKLCLENLARHRENPNFFRRLPPSRQEIEAVAVRLAPAFASVVAVF
jgi:hypothetical protein